MSHPSRRGTTRRGWRGQAESNPGDEHPVVCVNWDGAVMHCAHYGLRLPTEAEWEYAARGPERRRYPWGDEWDARECRHAGNMFPGGQTLPVGSFPSGASWCGALDLAGNVWEWCADRYGEAYYAKSAVADPLGPAKGQYRLLRGGSWFNDPYDCRSAVRNGRDPGSRGDGVGFRVARTP